MISRGFCNFRNLTILWLNYKYSGLASLDEKNNRIIGRFGPITEYILGTKLCKIIGVDILGSEYPNGTRTGAVDMVHRGQADFVYHLTSYLEKPSVFDFSFPVHHQTYVISHTLDLKTQKANTNVLDINMDAKYHMSFLTLLFISLLFFCFLFKRNSLRFLLDVGNEQIENFYKITSCYLKISIAALSEYQVHAVCIILYTVYIMSCFHKLFVINSFMTSNVLINTDQIIYNEQRLLETKRKICYFYLSETHSLITKAPEKNIFKRVLREKSFDPSCLFDTHILDINVDHLRNYEKQGFLITSYSFALVVINMFISHSGSPYWISGQFFAYNHCHILRKSLPENTKRMIKSFSLKYLEEGIYIHLYRTTAYISKHFQKDAARSINESLDTIIKEYTLFSANSFKSYEMLLIMFVSVQSFIFIVFVISKNKKYIESFLQFFIKRLLQLVSAINSCLIKLFREVQRFIRT